MNAATLVSLLAARPQPVPTTETLLLGLLLAAQCGSGPSGGTTRRTKKKAARARYGGLTLSEFCREHYLPEKGHAPHSATARLASAALRHWRECFGHDCPVYKCRHARLDRFRTWLAAKVNAGQLRGWTANKHLRHIRAILGHAWRKGILPRPRPIERLPQEDLDVVAWTDDELRRIVARAADLEGEVCGIAAAIWWPAWALVLAEIGPRIGAMMACRREDFSAKQKAILLRRANQKQKKDQRIALPKDAVNAVKRLLAAHCRPELFPWDFDPQPKSGRRRNFKTLTRRFRSLILGPLGIELPKGVATKQFRRTALTRCREHGGNPSALGGHSSPTVYRDHYADASRAPICTESLAAPELTQPFLFD